MHYLVYIRYLWFCQVGKTWKGEDFNLVRQKGIFPYEYMTSIDKRREDKLPGKEDFYSTLYETDVTD
jgi:hypothetical protein